MHDIKPVTVEALPQILDWIDAENARRKDRAQAPDPDHPELPSSPRSGSRRACSTGSPRRAPSPARPRERGRDACCPEGGPGLAPAVVGCSPDAAMFRIRQSYREDVEQVLAVAEHLDTVNLPADRGVIEGILDRSEKSFAAAVPAAEREFLFVLEDLAKKRIIGTSMIYAQHGTKRAPHIFFRVENDERYSVTLDRYFVHQTLRIGYNYNGPTEIGGLILLPEYRRNAHALGKALSYVRFLFIRMHRPMFRDHVLSRAVAAARGRRHVEAVGGARPPVHRA